MKEMWGASAVLAVLMCWLLCGGATAAASPLATNDCTAAFSQYVENLVEKLPTTIPIPITITIPINVPGVIEMELITKNFKLSGYKSLVGLGCQSSTDGKEVKLSVLLPQLEFTAENYILSGTAMNHIPISGDGAARILVEDLTATVSGVTLQNDFTGAEPVLVFESVQLDLDLDRWTVHLENLMPGTDLGQLITEFVMMIGPELFDVIEDQLNQTELLLKFLNILFPPQEGAIEEMISALTKKYNL